MNFLQRILLSGVLLLMSFPAFAQTSPQEEPSQKEIQDTVRAEQYFADEINFTINPHGVKSVLEGKNQNITLVDVRAAKNYAEGHVPGAINFHGLKEQKKNSQSCEKMVSIIFIAMS